MLILLAVWLLVIGYTLVYVGLSTYGSKPVSFKDAITGAG